jgi:hypothetical protein
MVDIEAEISAAKVRLGFGPQDPVDPRLVVSELPDGLERAFWQRQINRYFVSQGIGVNDE